MEKEGSVGMFINLRLWTRLQARLRGRTVMPVEGTSRAPGSGPLLYAIGDIHGCCRELDQLHHLILADVTERTMGQDRPVVLIYLGDYIDRGPDSRGVIARLLQPPPVPGAQRIFLKGNHEEALLDFLIDPEAAAGWLDFGGLETLSSYGVQQKGGGTLWRQKLGESLRVLLDRAFGTTQFVEKTRRLFLVGQTRVHLAEVEGLGSFMELEVVLRAEKPFRG